MKKRIFAFLCILVLVGGSLAGCGGNNTEETTGKAEDTMLPKDKTYEILFIGNSYTFYNNMPTAYFATMAQAAGYQLNVQSITKGAYTLEKFADPKDPYGALVANALSGTTKFDFVILQEQSARPATNPGAFYDGVRPLVERIREIGAQPVLYATWGRKEGSDTLEKNNMTSEEMTWKLASAYDAIAKELDIPVVHVGIAFRELYTGTKLELYNADKSHPSHVGSYVAALSLFCGIFGADPEDVPLSGPVEGEELTKVQEVVRKITTAEAQIPEEYQQSSVGVTAPTETTN